MSIHCTVVLNKLVLLNLVQLYVAVASVTKFSTCSAVGSYHGMWQEIVQLSGISL